MGAAPYQMLQPLLPSEQADAMLRLCERYGRYGTYNEETIEDDIGEGIAQRYDAAINFVKTGGRFGRKEPVQRLAARTNYFREEYFYGESMIEGIEPFLRHGGLHEAARNIYGTPVIEPSIVYANLLVPGQELAVHTDVPEFRGINRRKDPQWLIVAMHHSGLFDEWRMRIATGVSWFGNPEGGEFAFYPDGPAQPPEAFPVKHNTAIVLDTDSTFHGVDRVSEAREPLPELPPDVELVYAGEGSWCLTADNETLARYTWDDLRFSVSWKAYCYRDEAEQCSVHDHTDDLTREQVLDTLVADLRERGRLGDDRPDDTGLALTIIDEYIVFPPATSDSESS